jgi:hypothetical protein
MSFRRQLASSLVVVLAALPVPSLVAASAVKLKRPPKPVAETTLVPGHLAMLESAVTMGRWCRLSLAHPGAPYKASTPRRAISGLAEYQWRVPKNVAPGAWEATVGCGLTKAGLIRGEVTEAQSVTLHVSRKGPRFHGPAATAVYVIFPHPTKVPFTATGKGGGSYQPRGIPIIPQGGWLDGYGVTVFSNGGEGLLTGQYQCVDLVTRLIAAMHWSPPIWGNADQIYGDASAAYFDKHPNGSGYRPVPGDIVVWGGGEGGYGHVAVVDAISGSLLTVVEQNASPSGYNTYTISSSGYIAPRFGYYVEGFLHAKDNHIGATKTTPTPTLTQPTSTQTYPETTGGNTNTWSDYADAGGTEGPPIGANQTVQVACRTTGFTVADGNSWWYLIASGPWSDNYYASADAFYNNGQTSGTLQGTPFFDPTVPTCNGTKSVPTTAPVTSSTTSATTYPSSTTTTLTTTTTGATTSSSTGTTFSTSSSTTAPSSSTTTSTTTPPQTLTTLAPAPRTYPETVGGNTNTWTDYSDAGGTQGVTIPAYQTVQVTCAVQGFRVADGDTWWYEIASSPWDNVYYASADAFYNDGRTSGSLSLNPPISDGRPRKRA